MADVEQNTAKLLDQKYLFNGFIQRKLQWDGPTLMKVYLRLLAVLSDAFYYDEEEVEASHTQTSHSSHICKCLRLLQIDHLATKPQDLVNKSKAFRIISALDDKISAQYKLHAASRRIRLIIKKEQMVKTQKPKLKPPITSEEDSIPDVFPSVPLPKPCEPQFDPQPQLTKPISKPVQKKRIPPKPSVAKTGQHSPAPTDSIIPSGWQLQRTPEAASQKEPTVNNHYENDPLSIASLPTPLHLENVAEIKLKSHVASPVIIATSSSLHHTNIKTATDETTSSTLSPIHTFESPIVTAPKNEFLPAVPPHDEVLMDMETDKTKNVIPTGHQIPRTPKTPPKTFKLCWEENTSSSDEITKDMPNKHSGSHYVEEFENQEPNVTDMVLKSDDTTKDNDKEIVTNRKLNIEGQSEERNLNAHENKELVEINGDTETPDSLLHVHSEPSGIQDSASPDGVLIDEINFGLADCVLSPPSGYRDEETIVDSQGKQNSILLSSKVITNTKDGEETMAITSETFMNTEDKDKTRSVTSEAITNTEDTVIIGKPSETFIYTENKEKISHVTSENFINTEDSKISEKASETCINTEDSMIFEKSSKDTKLTRKLSETLIGMEDLEKTSAISSETFIFPQGKDEATSEPLETFKSLVSGTINIHKTFVVGDKSDKTFVFNNDTFVTNNETSFVDDEDRFVSDNEKTVMSISENTLLSNDNEETFVNEDVKGDESNLEALMQNISIDCTNDSDLIFQKRDKNYQKECLTDKTISVLCEDIEQNCSLQGSKEQDMDQREMERAKSPDVTFIVPRKRADDKKNSKINKTTLKNQDGTYILTSKVMKESMSSDTNIQDAQEDKNEEPMLPVSTVTEDTFISGMESDDSFEIFPRFHKASKVKNQKKMEKKDENCHKGNQGNQSENSDPDVQKPKRGRKKIIDAVASGEKKEEPKRRGRAKNKGKDTLDVIKAGDEEGTDNNQVTDKETEASKTVDGNVQQKSRRGRKKIDRKMPLGSDTEDENQTMKTEGNVVTVSGMEDKASTVSKRGKNISYKEICESNIEKPRRGRRKIVSDIHPELDTEKEDLTNVVEEYVSNCFVSRNRKPILYIETSTSESDPDTNKPQKSRRGRKKTEKEIPLDSDTEKESLSRGTEENLSEVLEMKDTECTVSRRRPIRYKETCKSNNEKPKRGRKEINRETHPELDTDKDDLTYVAEENVSNVLGIKDIDDSMLGRRKQIMCNETCESDVNTNGQQKPSRARRKVDREMSLRSDTEKGTAQNASGTSGKENCRSKGQVKLKEIDDLDIDDAYVQKKPRRGRKTVGKEMSHREEDKENTNIVNTKKGMNTTNTLGTEDKDLTIRKELMDRETSVSDIGDKDQESTVPKTQSTEKKKIGRGKKKIQITDGQETKSGGKKTVDGSTKEACVQVPRPGRSCKTRAIAAISEQLNESLK